MAITDNIRMIIKVCELYYEENLSQKGSYLAASHINEEAVFYVSPETKWGIYNMQYPMQANITKYWMWYADEI